MKIEKSNNPAAAGALILVLVLIVGRIVWMLFGQNKPVSAASTAAPPVSSAPPIPLSATPAVSTPRGAVGSTAVQTPPPRMTARNPFAHVDLVRPTSAQAGPGAASQSPDAHGTKKSPAVPLSPLTVRVGNAGVMDAGGPPSSLPGLGVVPSLASHGVSAQTKRPLPPEPNPLQSLKLTALVDGEAPMAIVQTAAPEPMVLHVGDELAGMRAAAINDQGVVFTRGGSHWTLALQTAADNSVTKSVSVTSDVTPEGKSDETQ